MAQADPFTDRDRVRLRAQGIGEDRAAAQLAALRSGRKFMRLDRACTLNDGIVRLSAAERDSLTAGYAEAAAQGRVMEFVPASGAATRMFKGLSAVMHRADRPGFAALVKEASQNADARETVEWFQGLPDFPFFGPLRTVVAGQGRDPDALLAAKEYGPFLEALLSPGGLAFSDKPKALIPFHLYPEGPHTALEEHLAEAAELVRDHKGMCRLHFTVSPDHEAEIQATLDSVRRKYEAAGIRFEIGLSQQKASTDTLSADQENRPARDAEGNLSLRPGGHGALLENLFHTGGDIVFIKNIDNIVPERLRAGVLAHRKALGGYMVRLQSRIFSYLRRLREGHDADLVEEAAHFVEKRLGTALPESRRKPATDARELAAKAEFLIRILDRPLRACAMVKNEGEPGGGPFWVTGKDGVARVQIVEAAQVDVGVPQQRKILESATHFNPVDLVCGLRDAQGELFKLQDFVDPDAFLISTKSKDGKTVRILELPGLWNGSMAFWNTVFVEAPIETFNPVKTVNDLLRPNHRSAPAG